MTEEMKPIDPITAAMLMGKTPEPCEPMIEIPCKALTRLMDVVEQRQLFAYQVGDNDIVAAYDPAGAIKVLVEFSGDGDYDYDDDDVDLVSDKVLDNTEAYDQDEGKIITLEKTLRQELAELTEPAYLHGWE